MPSLLVTPEARNELRAAIDQRVRDAVRDEGGAVELPPLNGKVRVVHGTEGAYTNYDCRCKPCREAAAYARHVRRNRQAPLRMALRRLGNLEAFTLLGETGDAQALRHELHARCLYAMQVLRGEIDP